ncbi:MAG: hypothetical protein ACO1TE_20215 [Prosthecobacter sp.]
MNIRTTRMGLEKSSWLGLCAVLLVAAPASAQNQRYYPQPQGGYTQPPPQYSQPPPNYQQPAPGYGYSYPQQQPQKRYENPIEFLPKFGKRMSEMVRRVFYGQDATGYDYPQQGQGSNGGYSLEEPPRQYSAAPTYPQQPSTGIYPPPGSYPQQPQRGYQYPPQQGQSQGQAQPRYSYPPQSQQPLPPATRSQTPPPQTRSSSPSPSTQSKSSTRTYSPPKVSQTPPKTTSKPSTTTTSSKPKDKEQPPAPAPTTTTRRSESSPPPQTSSNTSSLGSGSFLKGKKASKPGRVISPYPPYKELDITGLESGSLALDPTTQKVFEVP